jgi:hypothetical protein
VEGHGVFNVSASGGQLPDYNGAQLVFRRHSPFTAVAGDLNYWSRAGVYNSSGTYTGTVKTSMKDGGTLNGEWIQLSSPYGYYFKKTVLYHRYHSTGNDWPRGRMPKDFTFVGSNNGSSWSVIKSFGNISYEAVTGKQLEIDSKNVYKDVRLIVHSIVAVNPDGVSPNETTLDIGQWHLFGTPGPTTLDKGSLTLGRSLDVPRVSRYDVHTETPRPEKLILDYDTTINNSPLDISGSGNHGTFFGHAQYSAADKAFKFDGTGDTVYVDHNGNMGATTNFPTGDAIYTMSCWIKANSAQYSADAAVFYFGSAWTSYQLAGIYHGINGRINMDIGGHNMRTATGIIQSNRWYHVAIVKRGTGTITSARSYGSIYIDGVEIDPANLTYNAGGTQALQSIDNISIGSNFNGSPGSFGEAFNGLVSKPQIWNVALENSEIRKIYNLGRTGRSMVISDTAVGIGRYPRSQLDVRGIVRATTFISESQPLFIARPTASILYTTDNTIISNWTTLVNRGGFLKSSGYVYAPSAGVYYFHVNMYNETNQIGIIDLHHNGVIACRGELGTGVTNNSIITLFATVRMEAGDYVYLKNIGDVELISSGSSVYNQFVGYKLS